MIKNIIAGHIKKVVKSILMEEYGQKIKHLIDGCLDGNLIKESLRELINVSLNEKITTEFLDESLDRIACAVYYSQNNIN